MIEMANFTREQHQLAAAIARRAQLEVFQPQGVKRQVLDTMLDLQVVHHSCPLDLQKLHDFDRGNFGHDIAGIYRHLDRETGELGGCFLPRCALAVPADDDRAAELVPTIADEGLADDEHDPFRDDVEADADTLASAGYGTDEDYGHFGGDD